MDDDMHVALKVQYLGFISIQFIDNSFFNKEDNNNINTCQRQRGSTWATRRTMSTCWACT